LGGLNSGFADRMLTNLNKIFEENNIRIEEEKKGPISGML